MTIFGILRRSSGVIGLTLSVVLCPTAPSAAATRPLEIRVVVVTTWEESSAKGDERGELHAWLTRWGMHQSLSFPVGVRPLQYDPKRRVIAILTGMATARAAASIMALGLDPRFDLSHAYWIVAGTAGVDPRAASVGSTAWARWLVDGDLMQELDSRDMPPDWPTGIVPNDRTRPYEDPAPARHSEFGNVAFELNGRLADWAYGLTRQIALADDANLKAVRTPYSGAGSRAPFVLEGDGLMSARFWYGEHLNAWAERWVPYWTDGQGVFAMSAEEDTGILQALTMLAQDRRVRLDRVLVLRGASDYTLNPPGVSAADFLAQEARRGVPAEDEALDNLYVVASPVVRALADGWRRTRDRIPGD
jgi:purine nucleoside permease